MSYITDQVLSIQLKGSERQAQWAKTIRAQKVAHMNKMGNRSVLWFLRPLIVDEEIRQMNAWTPEKTGMLAAETVIMACSNPSARFWIDTKDEDPIEWLPAAWEKVRQYRLKHPYPDE